MELRRRFFKLLVQIICLVIALSGIFSLMYGQISKDQSLPRASYLDIVISGQEPADNAEDLLRKEELREIDTGREQSLTFRRSTGPSSSRNHGNGVMNSGADSVDAVPQGADGDMGRALQKVMSLKVRPLDFRDRKKYESTTSPPSDSHDPRLGQLKIKADSYSPPGIMKTMENFSYLNETNRRHAFQEDSPVLPADMMKSVRNQLREMREDFERKSVLVFDRANLPRNLTLLGKAIFRVVPDYFLPEYRSPCFHLHEEDRPSLACLPNVFLAGFPKCATTDLFKKLIRHPEVVATSKEPHWWTRTRFTRESVLHYLKHQTNLVTQMRDTGNRRLLTLDASASTLWDNTYSLGKFGSIHQPPQWTHADVLRAVLPEARFLLLLREPTERLYSGYMAFDSEWHGVKSPQDFHHRLVQSLQDFGRCMKRYPLGTCANFKYNMRLRVGMYSVFIRDWLKRYPREQIHILRTKEWAQDPAKELSRIFSFLEIDPLPRYVLFNITSSSRENQRKQKDRSLGKLLPASRQLLDEFYKPFKEDLAQLLQDEKYLWTRSM